MTGHISHRHSSSSTSVCDEQPYEKSEGNGELPMSHPPVPSDPDDDKSPSWGPMLLIERMQEACTDFCETHSTAMKGIVLLTLGAVFHTYLVLALLHDFQKATTLLVLTVLVWCIIFHKRIAAPFVKRRRGFEKFKQHLDEQFHKLLGNYMVTSLFYVCAVGIPLLYIIWDTRGNPSRLSGLLGLVIMFSTMCLLSNKPTKVQWRSVLWGFLLQFIFGLLVLKWKWGAKKFSEVADMATAFLEFHRNGTDFVYGFLSTPPNICGMTPVMAFQALQVLIYIGSIIAVLYFYGIVQAVLKQMARLMQLTLGTTATESLNACACVILGLAEAPLLIRPYLEKMTVSELQAVMTTGMSCISGSFFAVFIGFGACPGYLMSAALMGAPSSLACSKLLYPETEKSHTKSVKDLELPPSKEANAIDCMTNGAIGAVHLVTSIVAVVIAFAALMALFSTGVTHAGTLLGQQWSLELFLGYLFFPVAYIIGVTESFEQTMLVGQLLGTKVIISDYIAYLRLRDMIQLDMLSPRSAMLSTYALTSFSDLMNSGIQLAVLAGLAPSKRHVLSKLVLRALLGGCISCFMSTTLAGLLIDVPTLCKPHLASSTCFDINVHQKFMEDVLRANITGLAHLST